jgi:hypothetical protein
MLVCVLTAMRISWKNKDKKMIRAQMVKMIGKNIQAELNKLIQDKNK